MIHRFYLPFLIFALVKIEVNCNSNTRVKELIYRNVDTSKGFYPCFRRANGTHQFGCQSEPGGNIGVVHLVSKANETEDLNWVTSEGPRFPYVGKLINTYLTTGIYQIQLKRN